MSFQIGKRAADSADPHIFDMSAQIFGHIRTAPENNGPTSVEVAENGDEKDEDTQSDSTSSERSLITALASVAIAESPWRSAPSYPTLYLSTVSEYLPPQTKPKVPKGIRVSELGDDEKKDKDVSWATETYENSLEMDHIFERFTKRIGYEGKQCVRSATNLSHCMTKLDNIDRYELRGTPLPFASDKTFDLLWPMPRQEPLPVTKAAFKVVPAVRRVYDASSVPRCSACGSERVFECQLTPNLINELRPSWADESQKLTDRERREAVKRALVGDNKELKRGLEWGTCLVYSCEKDCSENDGCWREEVVYVQWDV